MYPTILFTSPYGLYSKVPIDKDPIDTFYYRNTYKQKMFQLRAFQSWHSLHFIAQNIEVSSVVLENPSFKEFQKEIKNGHYQMVAIGFTMLLANSALQMVTWLRNDYPNIEIVLGGYGTAIFSEDMTVSNELKSKSDYICYGEGVQFFRKLVKNKWNIDSNKPLIQNLFPAENSFFRTRFKLFKQIIVVSGLGCLNGCSFCSTSIRFSHKYIPLFTGKMLFESLLQQTQKYPTIESAIIYDENFLQHREQVLEFMQYFEKSELSKKTFLLTIFSSVESVNQYSMDELIRCGIGTIFIGVESFNKQVLQSESLKKRTGDAEELFNRLHSHGINTLGSLIVGWDGQSLEDIQLESTRYVKMNPTFYQVIPLHPSPGTRLWERIKQEGRIIKDYKFETDGIVSFNFETQNYSAKQAIDIIFSTYSNLVNEGGPWPFRLFENLMHGYINLKDHTNSTFRQRAEIYRTMAVKISILAVSCRLLFYGRGFSARWNNTMKICRQQFPFIFWSNIILSPIIAMLLLGMYGYGFLRHHLSKYGDQPNKSRRIYMK